MLQATEIFVKRGSLQLFENLSFTVHPGHKVGVVGRNGAGKSTLFQLALGQLQADEGDVTMPPGWQITHLEQQVQVTDRPAREHVIDGHRRLRSIQRRLAQAESAGDDIALANLHADYADAGGHEAEARAGAILHGLGFVSGEFDKPFHEFSGGMRIRLNLAKALMAPCDLLLLDEPTNHLDLETTLWLESWLQRFPGTLLVIAHDRAFLDGVCDQILHIALGRADSYRGNYSSFERQRAQALAARQAENDRQQAQRRHMQQFVERFRAKASKARQAQSRLKALERMKAAAPLHAESPYRFRIENPDRMSYPLVDLNEVTIGYGDVEVLRHVTLSLLPGARIGILGANGAGKSTLLKCLSGELPARGGELQRGRHSHVGYLAQHPLDSLRPEATALQTLIGARAEMGEQQCRDYLGRWGFGADKTSRPLATLSGGEKVRLLLALVALEKPAVLVLDEPTNHLDLDMREALAIALQDYTGALLLVSHDRALLERSVDEFWLVKDGRVQRFTGDLLAYTASQQTADAQTTTANPRKQQRRDAAARRHAEKPLRDRVASLDSTLEKLTAELAALEGRLADPDIYRSMGPDELSKLLTKAGHLRKETEDAERAWMEAVEELERFTSG